MTVDAWITLVLFILCYILFVVLPGKRAKIAIAASLVIVILTPLTWQQAVFQEINWNVMGLFIGTMLLAELFMLSKVPPLMAEWLIGKCRTARVSMLALCTLAGFISIFLENVAVVLLIAPIAITLAQKLKTSPVPLLIGIAITSNLQGAATMIGDPPSMILAGFMRMGFWDFFIYHKKPGIFFIIQVGMLASVIVLAYFFRKEREPVVLEERTRPLSWIPTWFLIVLVAGLSFSTMVDPDFKWFAGTFTLGLSGLALLWQQKNTAWKKGTDLIRSLDWDTVFFLAGVFILAGSLANSGWMDQLAHLMAKFSGGNSLHAFLLVVALSVFISGFVDNVPFLLVMIPVAQKITAHLGLDTPLLMFGLLTGACLGGNLTPLGASANIVTIGLLKQQGYEVKFNDFLRISIPYTIAAVSAASILIWYIWR